MPTAGAVRTSSELRLEGARAFGSQTDPRFKSRSCHLLESSDLNFLICRLGMTPHPPRSAVGWKRDNEKALSGNAEGTQQGEAQR